TSRHSGRGSPTSSVSSPSGVSPVKRRTTSWRSSGRSSSPPNSRAASTRCGQRRATTAPRTGRGRSSSTAAPTAYRSSGTAWDRPAVSIHTNMHIQKRLDSLKHELTQTIDELRRLSDLYETADFSPDVAKEVYAPEKIRALDRTIDGLNLQRSMMRRVLG